MNYQLVIQFLASSIENFDAIVELEDEIESKLGLAHILDGHDFGSEEMNIFIHTNNPEQALLLAQESERFQKFEYYVAAFRAFKSETYKILWPKHYDKEFNIV